MPIRTLFAGALLALCATHASAAAANPCWDAGSCKLFTMHNPFNHNLLDGNCECQPQYHKSPARGNVGAPPRVVIVNKVDASDEAIITPSYPAGTAGAYRASTKKCGGVFTRTSSAAPWTTILVPNPFYLDPTGQPNAGESPTIPTPCGFYYVADVCAVY